MPNYKVVDANKLDNELSDIADAIREQTGDVDQVFLFPDGFVFAPAELVEVGKKSAYDEFWDAYQDNGNRTNYENGFSGYGWTNATFKPKYDIRPTTAAAIFYRSQITGSLPDILQEIGVSLDLSGVTSAISFQNALFSRLGVLDCSECTSLGNAFAYCGSLVTIDELIVGESTTYSNNTFAGCWNFANITMGGTIAANISFAQCSKLTAESAKSVISCLKNFTGTGNEATRTVTFHANTWALLDAEGEASPNGNTWREYIVSDLRWNI